MKTIKGVYINGEIKLLEAAPDKGNQKVFITFIEDELSEDDETRQLSLMHANNAIAEYLKEEQEDLYQDYVQKNK